MKYLHQAFKADKGEVVVVKFSEPTRVMLMDSRNYWKYANTASFQYHGGESSSPRSFVIPKASTWYVVVEKGWKNKEKNLQASVEIMPPGSNAPGLETSAAPAKQSPVNAELANELDSILDAEE